MEMEIITQMYEYGIWANKKLLDTASALTAEQLRKPFTKHEFTILGSFVHLVSAEWRWHQSWSGVPMENRLTVDDLPTLDAVQARWEQLYVERRAFIESLTPERLQQPLVRKLQGQEQSIPLWQTLVHVANHGTQHRSEIALMLTDLGHSPGDLDMVWYFMGRL
jgi:uncharacterized damage-inducible protein DinB